MAAQNTARYLEACLDSILQQTYSNWELIAVNDHSTDDTLRILDHYSENDKRIKSYDGRSHRLIPILQEAYSHSSGALINRMDSDDMMPDYKLEVLVNEWKKFGKGHVIAGGTKHFKDEGKVGDGFIKYETWLNHIAKNGLHSQEIYRECVIPSHSWIMHRDDLNKVGAFDPIVYPEDYDLTFRIYRSGLHIKGLDKVLHYWRDRSDRISRTWPEYKDNRYFDLKLNYFFDIDRDKTRPLLIWGAGKNGKDFAKLLLDKQEKFHWISDNEKKIGKDIYEVKIESSSRINEFNDPQILIVVSSPNEREEIRSKLSEWNKEPVKDYWFFI